MRGRGTAPNLKVRADLGHLVRAAGSHDQRAVSEDLRLELFGVRDELVAGRAQQRVLEAVTLAAAPLCAGDDGGSCVQELLETVAEGICGGRAEHCAHGRRFERFRDASDPWRTEVVRRAAQ